ncbi:6-hydroxy-d-nicotine oxidase [Colletotrichum asianum]
MKLPAFVEVTIYLAGLRVRESYETTQAGRLRIHLESKLDHDTEVAVAGTAKCPEQILSVRVLVSVDHLAAREDQSGPQDLVNTKTIEGAGVPVSAAHGPARDSNARTPSVRRQEFVFMKEL